MIGGKKKGDPRVASVLNQLDLKYEVDSDGDYRLLFGLGGGRSQLVFVDSKTYQYKGLEVRSIWSPAYTAPTQFSADVSFALLRDSRNRKLGAWEVAKQASGYVALFTAKIGADLDAATFAAVMTAVVGTADELEKELTGGDRF